MFEEYLEVLRSSPRPIHFTDSKSEEYECKQCKDSGWINEKDDYGRDVAKRCGCWALRQSKFMFAQSGISDGFREKTLENFDTRRDQRLIQAKSKASGYIQSFAANEKTRHNSILFCGQVGAGKTHLGIAISNCLMGAGIAVSYMPYRNAITKIKQNITDEAEYNKELEKYMRARVLYVDDLLKGKITESDANILYELVNHRYMNNLPFIISTEKTIDGLLDFDEAIGSRIIEMCRGNIVQLQGKDLNHRLR